MDEEDRAASRGAMSVRWAESAGTPGRPTRHPMAAVGHRGEPVRANHALGGLPGADPGDAGPPTAAGLIATGPPES
ncbi:hypothetical protein [Streptomyces sp. NPDC057418]|uniref:hypothetical protein n=1 Tax=Streptomyces sp. NPDC057418 TaxID=3346126 RepID=UPI00368A4EA3